MPKRQAVRIGFTLKTEIYEFMKTICIKREDGFAEYQNGWSDAKVAQQCGVTTRVVHNLRNTMFGRLNNPRIDAKNANAEKLIVIIENLQRRAAYLEQALGVTPA